MLSPQRRLLTIVALLILSLCEQSQAYRQHQKTGAGGRHQTQVLTDDAGMLTLDILNTRDNQRQMKGRRGRGRKRRTGKTRASFPRKRE